MRMNSPTIEYGGGAAGATQSFQNNLTQLQHVKVVNNMTATSYLTGLEDTRDLLTLRRSMIKQRRRQKASVLTGNIVPLPFPPAEPTATPGMDDYPKIA